MTDKQKLKLIRQYIVNKVYSDEIKVHEIKRVLDSR